LNKIQKLITEKKLSPQLNNWTSEILNDLENSFFQHIEFLKLDQDLKE